MYYTTLTFLFQGLLCEIENNPRAAPHKARPTTLCDVAQAIFWLTFIRNYSIIAMNVHNC